MLVIVLILIIQCKSVIKTFFVYVIMSIEPEIISKHQIEVLQKKVIIHRFLLLSFLFCHSSCSFTRGKFPVLAWILLPVIYLQWKTD